MSDFSLVMPFVVCQSKGGPYEDESYVAGYEAGYLDGILKFTAFLEAQGLDVSRPDGGDDGQPFHAANTDQIDLIAMRHGWVVTFSDEVDGWVQASFTRSGS